MKWIHKVDDVLVTGITPNTHPCPPPPNPHKCLVPASWEMGWGREAHWGRGILPGWWFQEWALWPLTLLQPTEPSHSRALPEQLRWAREGRPPLRPPGVSWETLSWVFGLSSWLMLLAQAQSRKDRDNEKKEGSQDKNLSHLRWHSLSPGPLWIYW